MLLSRPLFFPGSAAVNLVATLSISSVEREYPYTSEGSSQHPTGGLVLGKSHFDFSMLVFSADFPPATKLRWKRTKTADAAVVVPHSKKQARLSSSRACYFCSKYLEKSCITLDISDNSFASYSFSAFIIRAISKSRSVAAGLPLMLFFSAEAPSR